MVSFINKSLFTMILNLRALPKTLKITFPSLRFLQGQYLESQMFSQFSSHVNNARASGNIISNQSQRTDWFMQIATWLSIYTLVMYGVSLYLWNWITSFSILNYFLTDEDRNIATQGTLGVLFPDVVPKLLFASYAFAYRVEICFGQLTKSKQLKREVVIRLNKLRRSPISINRLIGRTATSGFMGGMPQMPGGGNPRGMIVWGTVVVAGIAMNQYRLYHRDKMQAHNEFTRDTTNAANERAKNTTNAANERARDIANAANVRAQNEAAARNEATRIQNEAAKAVIDAKNRCYELELKAYNDTPYWRRGKPPTPPSH